MIHVERLKEIVDVHNDSAVHLLLLIPVKEEHVVQGVRLEVGRGQF